MGLGLGEHRHCLWEPRRLKNVEQDCPRLTKSKGKVVVAKSLDYKSKRRHLITDYSHVMPKLHCPWDDDELRKRNEISPGKLYHGLGGTDVTERLNPKPPSHAAHPSLIDAPKEYHGRTAQDVTEMYTFASRGKRPPSRDYYHGREATDISEFLRIIPPVAKEGDESNEFFGRPKSDVTDYRLLPLQTIDTNSRTEAARPLGRCPPGPMCDYAPLVRDKDGKMIRPQLPRTPSPLCESGTHELPVSTTLVKRHQPESENSFVPFAGGILAQIVPGFSRSEAKKPVGRGIPGVMADYVQLERDETGKVLNLPPPRTHSPGSPGAAAAANYKEPRVTGNRYDKKHPLGQVPVGVMHDYLQNPSKGIHKHTTDGYWSVPVEYPPSPPCGGSVDAAARYHDPSPGSPHDSATSKTLKGAKKKLKKDRRRNAVCEMHDPGCPLAAEQGHVSSCISHPAVSSYVKWPKDGSIDVGPCKKHGGRAGIITVKGSPCSSEIVSRKSTAGDDAKSSHSNKPCSSPSSGRGGSHSPRSYNRADQSSLANQSPLRPDTACPRVACQCIRVANKGAGPPSYGYAESISRLDPKYPKNKTTPRPGIAGSGSARGSSGSVASSSQRKKTITPKKKSMAFVTEETSPQHFQVPYYGLAATYVTNPAVSPNVTPPLRRGNRVDGKAHGEENMPRAKKADVGEKGCNQADVCKHHHDGKSAWFGRSKTFVTDPAVSPNLTPPCFNTFR